MVSRLIMDHMDPNEAIVITVREGGRRERGREREKSGEIRMVGERGERKGGGGGKKREGKREAEVNGRREGITLCVRHDGVLSCLDHPIYTGRGEIC